MDVDISQCNKAPAHLKLNSKVIIILTVIFRGQSLEQRPLRTANTKSELTVFVLTSILQAKPLKPIKVY